MNTLNDGGEKLLALAVKMNTLMAAMGTSQAVVEKVEVKDEKPKEEAKENKGLVKTFLEDIKKLIEEGIKKTGGEETKEKRQYQKDVEAKLKEFEIPGLEKSVGKIEFAIKRLADGRKDTAATILSYKAGIKELDEYSKIIDEKQKKREEYFKTELAKHKEGSEEYKILLEQQTLANENHLKEEAVISEKRTTLITVKNSADITLMDEIHAEMKAKWDEYGKFATDSLKATSDYFAASSEAHKTKAEKIKKEIAKVDEALKASNDKQKSLIEEAKTATGGRAQVVEEQIAREIAAAQELASQKASLAADEKKERDKAEKEERRSKRIALVQGIVTSTANVAIGIAKELTKGLWGIPTAAIIAAQGAIQIATIKKQFDKINMEDGGLLHGKRHTQGGMRIEGTNIEVEGDEYVVNRISTRQNLGLVDYINRSKRQLSPQDIEGYYARSGQSPQTAQNQMKRMYQDGGVLTNLDLIDTATTQSESTNKMLQAIAAINFKPVVSVVDIMKTQDTVVSIRDIAGV